MDYTISYFTTQKSTTPILALKLSVSAIITPGGLPQFADTNMGHKGHKNIQIHS